MAVSPTREQVPPLTTMVCLTLGRQSLLPLLLQRYADKPLHVVIVDGTSEPWVYHPDFSPGYLTWEYIHHPGPSIAKYFERFVLGLERVRTDFVVWGSDDDVILWDGIVLSINHLRSNPEHLLAGGRVIRVDTGTLSVHPWQHWGKPLHIEGMPMARVLKVMSTQRTANYRARSPKGSSKREGREDLRRRIARCR